MAERYYKYRSLENLKRFLDIIVDNKLYASKLNELNDPMEGVVKFDKSIDKKERTRFRNEKINKCYVCSVSKKPKDGKPNGHLMAYYANSHKGCCIEFEITAHTSDNYKEKDWHKIEVEYVEVPPKIENTGTDDLYYALKYKSIHWKEENEVRFVKIKDEGDRPLFSISIKRILMGVKVSNSDFQKYKKMILGINNNIEVIHLKDNQMDYGWLAD